MIPNQTAKQERLNAANAFVRAIFDCGRKFFRQGESVAFFEVDRRGRVWWHDECSGKRVYTHFAGHWSEFTHGGTMRRLVQCLRDFIVRGTPMPRGILGPWPEWYGEGDPWGYGLENMERLRKTAADLGVLDCDGQAKESKA